MSKNPKVTIGLILYKGEKYLGCSLPSLINQDYSNIEFLFRDQSPNGEAYDYIQKNLPDLAKKVKLEKGGNLWHSGGHNSLIRKMKGDYYFCCSNDMLYDSNFVSHMVKILEKSENKRFGSATCKLLRWNFKDGQCTIDKSVSTVIDSCGIGITKGHHFYDRGQGETNHVPYSSYKEIFGPSGALAVFRKEALDDISYKNDKGEYEYFDELLHYKNDVDLAYRLQWAGYPSLFIPEVKVYHDRQVASMSDNFLGKIVSHQKKSDWAKGNSLFGHLIVLKKNFSNKFSFEVKASTLFNRILRYLHTAFFNPNQLEQYKQVKKFKFEIQKKKKNIVRKKSAKAIEKLMD
ncbi:glycosyltransferase [Patescibacteria group bacterium]|nr:glycosyltransferase [Patescibacteria group bacterium]